MKKFPLIVIGVTLLVIVGGLLIFSKKENNPVDNTPLPPASGFEYFWGDGCPHCKNVQEFFDSWENYDNIKLEKYEVWSNKANSERMKKRALSCKIDEKDLAVPMLYTPNGECLIGDGPIIDLFSKMEFTTPTPTSTPTPTQSK